MLCYLLDLLKSMLRSVLNDLFAEVSAGIIVSMGWLRTHISVSDIDLHVPLYSRVSCTV